MFRDQLIAQLKGLIKRKGLIILEIGQINFIKGFIGEKLSLEASFGLNWEDQNFWWRNFSGEIGSQNLR